VGKGRLSGILIALVGAGVVAWLWRFNKVTPYGEHYLVVNILALLWVPMMFIFLIAKDDPGRYGFTFSSADWKRSWLPTLLLFAGVMVFLLPASRMQSFQQYYPIDPMATTSLNAFIFFELSYGLYLFCWEFFFRGFLLFGLQKSIGWAAVLPQAIAFGLLHYGKPTPEFIVSFPAGIILGLLALRGRSFFPCFLLHWASALTFDLLVIWARHS
jgi:membrane protease YdiL (CAAX protease family)